MSLQFILSQKNGQKLTDGGYLYIKEKADAEKTFWKCDQFKRLRCRARIHTAHDEIVKRIGEHSHAGEAGRIEAIRVVNKVKELARSGQIEDTEEILAEALFGLSQSVVGQMPSAKALKKTVLKTKKRTNQPNLPNPHSLHELDIPLPYQTTHAGVEFLLFDSADERRILLFSTSNNLHLLSQFQIWYATGSLKAVPPLFQQFYVIHAVVNTNIIPVVYAFLARKDEETFKRFLDALTQLQPNLSPTMIINDFETAYINAFSIKFPGVQQKGSFYHFCQRVYGNIQQNGLQQRYETDSAFSLKMRMVAALAFLPISLVCSGFEQLSDGNFPSEGQPVLDYVEDTFIGRLDHRLQRRSPAFAHFLWNCYDLALGGIFKTNSSFESWHCAFENSITASQPSIWKFITAIKNEQKANEEKIDRYISGAEVDEPSKKRYRDSATKIERVVQMFDNDILTYLSALANTFNF